MSRAVAPQVLALLALAGCGEPDESDMSGPWAGTCTVETAQGESLHAFTLQVDTEGPGTIEGSGSISFSGSVWSGTLSGELVQGEANLVLAADVEGSALELFLDGTVVGSAWTGTCELQSFPGTFDAAVGG